MAHLPSCCLCINPEWALLEPPAHSLETEYCLFIVKVASTFWNSVTTKSKLGLLMANFKDVPDPNFLNSLHMSSGIPAGVIAFSPGEGLAVQGLSQLLQF